MHEAMVAQVRLNSRWRSRGYLAWQLTRREVLGRYKGSLLGLAWSFVYPMLMLVVYTLVFSIVFKSRWGTQAGQSKVEFALTLFCGLIAFNLFAENLTRAPGLILANPNYVTKVVFPLEILPVAILGASLINGCISIVILLMGELLLLGHLSETLFYFPLVLIPLILLSVGVSWFLASLGVFVRDLQQVTAIIVQALMFLSPVFYPITALPPSVRQWALMNPLSPILENFRRTLILGQPPEWHWLVIEAGIALVFAWAGYVWFAKTKKAFADVL